MTPGQNDAQLLADAQRGASIQSIIDKPPSAGLWPGQTDEGDLGFSYDELDRYLVTGEASAEVRGRIESMMAASDHKRLPLSVPTFQAASH